MIQIPVLLSKDEYDIIKKIFPTVSILGIDITKEEAEAYLDELSECELKDGDLKHVAGGASDTHECRDLEQPY